jgi:hypothetical protein
MTPTEQRNTFAVALTATLTRWHVPGRQIAVRATRAPAGRRPVEVMVTCQVWSSSPDGSWHHRASIPVDDTSTLLDVVQAVVAEGWSVGLTDDDRPKWRVDSNGPVPTYILDVVRP